MKRIGALLFLFCFCIFILPGCSNVDTPPSLCRVVTQIDITYTYKDGLLRRHYTDHDKMKAVLLYVRLMKPLHPATIDPDTPEADCEIVLSLSDGKKRIYKQKAHRYISKDGSAWKTLNADYGLQLYKLIYFVPSDPEI